MLALPVVPYLATVLVVVTVWALACVLYDGARHERSGMRIFLDGLIVIAIVAVVTLIGVVVADRI